MQTNTPDLILLKSLPVVKYKHNYLVFSPFNKKIAEVSEQELNSKELIKELEKQKFFGKPRTAKFSPKITQLSFGLTNDCNLLCKYCYGFYGGPCKKDYLSKETIINIFKKTIKSYTREVRVTFIGGEPTLSMDVIKTSTEYLKKLNLKKIRLHISTNGLVSKKDLDYLIQSKFSFNVSHDGLPDIQDFQRPTKTGGSSVGVVENTIKELIKQNAKFKVRVTVTSHNVKLLDRITEHLSKLGVKYIHLDKVSYCGRAPDQSMLEPDPKEYVYNLFKAMNIAEKEGSTIINSAYSNLFIPSTFYCTHIAGEAKLIVGPRGIITNCYEHLEDDRGPFYLGRIKDNKIELNKTKRDEIIKKYNVEKIKECRVCPIKYICGAGCPQHNYLKTKNPFKPAEDECWMEKEIIRRLIIRMYERG
ncbi:MAG: radical SAM protein [Candidatus Nanoarchaeia archaeon]|nr:radical SAM protein [Candidatus Nanoarchaeia archaeon]